jgi:hypothetical protein
MGLSLVGLTNPQRGCEAAETGINLESFECRYFPQFKDKLNNYQGQVRGFAIPDKFDREVRIQGETDGTTGIMAAVLNTATTFGNDVSTWVAISAGSNAGGFYMDEATETQTRDGWRSINISFSSNPLVT